MILYSRNEPSPNETGLDVEKTIVISLVILSNDGNDIYEYSLNPNDDLSQCLPCKPLGQLHLYPGFKDTHEPPFKHGLGRHESADNSHMFPRYPGLHKQKYPMLS